MRNFIRRATLAPATAALAISGSAHAATNTFTDKTAFLSGLTTTVVDDYNAAGYHTGLTNAQMDAVFGQTDYTAGGANTILPAYDFLGGNMFCVSAGAGCNGALGLDFTSASLATAAGVFAVGFNFLEPASNYSYGSPFSTTINVTFGDDSTASYVVRSDIIFPTFPDTTPAHSRFFGVQSDLGVKSISIPTVARQILGAPQNSGVAIDNLTLGANGVTAAVPEPATWAMMIAGFFGVGVMARRRGRALAA